MITASEIQASNVTGDGENYSPCEKAVFSPPTGAVSAHLDPNGLQHECCSTQCDRGKKHSSSAM